MTNPGTEECCFYYCLKRVPYVMRGLSTICKGSAQGDTDTTANFGNGEFGGFPEATVIPPYDWTPTLYYRHQDQLVSPKLTQVHMRYRGSLCMYISPEQCFGRGDPVGTEKHIFFLKLK